MAQLNIVKNYDDGLAPIESWFDDFYESIETFFNVTKLNSDNFQDSSFSADKIASLAATTAKFDNNAVTDAKLQDDGSVDANRSVSTDHIQDSAVSTAKIAAGVVTRAMGATDNASDYTGITSAGSGDSTTSTSFADCISIGTCILTMPNTGVTKIVAVTMIPAVGSSVFLLDSPNANVDYTLELRKDSSAVAQIILSRPTVAVGKAHPPMTFYLPTLCDGDTLLFTLHHKIASGASAGSITCDLRAAIVG